MADEDLLATLVDAHRSVYEQLLEATADLEDDGWSTSTGCPGWDVHDQLAHCVAVERLMLGEPAPEVALPPLPHVADDDFSMLMEAGVQVRRGVPGERLRDEARDVFARRLAALSALEPSALRDPVAGPAGMQGKASTVLRIRVFDLTAHEQDVRRALGRQRDPEGPHGELVARQVLRGLARVLPERLAGPGILLVEIVGPHAGSVRVELPGQGAPGPESAPSASLRGTLAELLAVACGRSDAPGADRLHADGERGLAEEALRHAAMTP